MAKDKSWIEISKKTNMLNHDFSIEPFVLMASEIKNSMSKFYK